MNPTILPNTDPNLRLIVATWDLAAQCVLMETKPIIAWWIAPYRQPEPICLTTLRGTAWGLEDEQTGCVEIPDDGFHYRDEAKRLLQEKARMVAVMAQRKADETAKEV